MPFRLQCQVDDQQRHLQDEKQRNVDLQMRLESMEYGCSKEILMREASYMEVRLIESNSKLTSVLELIKAGRRPNKQWLKY